MTTLPFSPPDPSLRIAPPRPTRPVAGRIVLTVGALALAASLLVMTSLALFTDSAAVGGNTFSAGSVDISTSPTSALVTFSGMAPGDQNTAPITVSNDGSLELRYAIESTTTEDVLAAELVLTVKSGVSTCDDANWSADGATLYSGRLGSVATDAVVGSSSSGADAGDRVLAGSANEVVCVNVTLPLSTSSGEGLTTTATLDFVAEQTANNP